MCDEKSPDMWKWRDGSRDFVKLLGKIATPFLGPQRDPLLLVTEYHPLASQFYCEESLSDEKEEALKKTYNIWHTTKINEHNSQV